MLTLQNTEAIRRIEEAIGYTFNDKRLLIQVLTRKTYLKIDPEAPDNEVLEFYGDTLMNYHVTNYFMSKYAHMLDDGLFFMRTVEQFTDMRSHYVCNRYLTDRIKAMGLARYLRAQNRDAELRRDGEKAYADVFESLVGAIYLDSCQNDTLIRAFILRQLGIEPKCLPADIEAFDYDSLTAPAFAESPAVALEEPETPADLPAPEAAFAVQEPVREEADEAADGTAVEADAEETPVETPVEIPAEAPAVEASLSEETLAEAVSVPAEPEAVLQPMQDALAAYCREWGLDEPTYGQTPPNAPNARPVAACTMKYKDAKGKLVKISLNDSGKTLAEATEKAAAKMLKKLEKLTADRKKKAADKPAEVNPVEAEAEKAELLVPEAREAEAEVTTVEPAVETAVIVEEPTVEVAVAEKVEEAVEPTAEVAPIADVSAEDAPAVETAEAVPAEAEAPSEDLAAVEEAAVAEATFDVQEMTVAEPTSVEEFVQQTMELPVEPAPVEEVAAVEEAEHAKAPRRRRTEAADGSDKPAKKAPSKKKPTPKEDRPAEKGGVTENPAEASGDASAETAVKVSKPRARKPRTKKQETVSEVSAEDGQGQAE